MCPQTVRDTFLTLRAHSRDTFGHSGAWRPREIPSDTPSDTRTPLFRGHSRGHFGPKGPRDSFSRPGGSQVTTLSFLFFFGKKARQTTKKPGILYPYRTPEIPGKEGRNGRKNKEFLAGEENKEFKKKEGKEGQGNLKVRGRGFQDGKPTTTLAAACSLLMQRVTSPDSSSSTASVLVRLSIPQPQSRTTSRSIPARIGRGLRGYSPSVRAVPTSQEQKFSPKKRKFLAGYPCGHPAKNFGQPLQMPGKTSILGRTSRADVHEKTSV